MINIGARSPVFVVLIIVFVAGVAFLVYQNSSIGDTAGGEVIKNAGEPKKYPYPEPGDTVCLMMPPSATAVCARTVDDLKLWVEHARAGDEGMILSLHATDRAFRVKNGTPALFISSPERGYSKVRVLAGGHSYELAYVLSGAMYEYSDELIDPEGVEGRG